MVKICPNLRLAEYFRSASNPLHKQYLAMKMFFDDEKTADEVANAFGYTKWRVSKPSIFNGQNPKGSQKGAKIPWLKMEINGAG